MFPSEGIQLNVPLLSQHRLFAAQDRDRRERIASNKACWYTACYMVLLYRLGPAAAAKRL